VAPTQPAVKPAAVSGAPASKPARKKKISFKESQELARLPDQIDALEQERAGLFTSLTQPLFIKSRAAAEARTRLTSIEDEIARLTARWEELESIAAGS
jgi:ATP-binding cassette subfamily F protein uup